MSLRVMNKICYGHTLTDPKGGVRDLICSFVQVHFSDGVQNEPGLWKFLIGRTVNLKNFQVHFALSPPDVSKTASFDTKLGTSRRAQFASQTHSFLAKDHTFLAKD